LLSSLSNITSIFLLESLYTAITALQSSSVLISCTSSWPVFCFLPVFLLPEAIISSQARQAGTGRILPVWLWRSCFAISVYKGRLLGFAILCTIFVNSKTCCCRFLRPWAVSASIFWRLAVEQSTVLQICFYISLTLSSQFLFYTKAFIVWIAVGTWLQYIVLSRLVYCNILSVGRLELLIFLPLYLYKL
jgi:hypothetical protein